VSGAVERRLHDRAGMRTPASATGGLQLPAPRGPRGAVRGRAGSGKSPGREQSGNSGVGGDRMSARRTRVLQRDPPAYKLITDTLRQSIQRGRLPPGQVLQEGSLAELFGSSRSPVKAALRQLISERLLSRCDGRGVLVGGRGVSPGRTPLTHAMLGLQESGRALPRLHAWQKIYGTIERELLYRSIFGRFQVNELELARHYHAGRTVAHDALLRLQANGIVTKGEKAHWYVVPLDSKRLNELYDLRKLIEPMLAATAAARIPADTLGQMRSRLDAAMRRHPQVRLDELDDLEHDLHVSCLEYGGNTEMLEALRRTRCILISGKHILGRYVPYPPLDPFLGEHLAVIQAFLAREPRRARQAMRAHLESAHAKVETRLQEFRRTYVLTPISFVTST
jgi:DNA-binding GntR family transcriptional regulator